MFFPQEKLFFLFKYDFERVHIKNVLHLLQLNAKRHLQKLRQDINREEWTDHGPTTVNAFYRALYNEISKEYKLRESYCLDMFLF